MIMEKNILYLGVGLIAGVIIGHFIAQTQNPLTPEIQRFLNNACQARGFERFSGFGTGIARDASGKITEYELGVHCSEETYFPEYDRYITTSSQVCICSISTE